MDTHRSVNDMRRTDFPGNDESGRTNTTGNGAGSERRRHAFRSLLLSWTDPESGDELTIDLRGGSDFARGLAEVGFEVLASRGAGEPSGLHAGDIEAVAEQRMQGQHLQGQPSLGKARLARRARVNGSLTRPAPRDTQTDE